MRGYLEAEDLGDYGATLQTELRSPSLAKYIGKPVKSWRFHVFYDAGEVTLARPLPGYPSTFGLSSVGVGTRVNLWGNLDASIQDAQTLTTGTTTHAGTNRVLFRVSGEF